MRVFLYCSLFCITYASNETVIFKYINDNKTVEECKNCLSKCCPGNQIVLTNNGTPSCVENVYNLSLQDLEVPVFKSGIKHEIVKTDKSLKSFEFMYADVFWDEFESFEVTSDGAMQLYLLEDGNLAMRFFNFINQWRDPHFTPRFHCLEVQVTASYGILDPSSVTLIQRGRDKIFEEDQYKELKMNIKTSVMVVSSIFLFLTLAAYAVLPQKRNLPSLMLMTFVTCLMVTFIFRAVQVFAVDTLPKEWCTFIGLTLYFSLWCTFTWMNVMSYDMWSTTCGMHSPHWQPRKKILTKFVGYSVYGFGVPLLLTTFMVGVDFADLRSTPYFIKPHFVASSFCFFASENERRLYINTPIAVATLINVIFFVMTAVYMWKTRSGLGVCGDSRNNKADQNRFAIYVKMALITGITWILDVLGAFIYPDHWAWVAADIFNSSIGLFIFYSFVCKREILVLLCKRFETKTSFARQWESTAVTSVSVSKRQMSQTEAGTAQKPDFFTDKAAF